MKFSSEKQLYPIIKNYLAAEGYTIRSEVHGCDVMAVKGDVTVIVELKLAFNLKLVFQVLNRQTLCNNVYIALPEYAIDNRSKRKVEILNLMKRLGIGVFSIGNRLSGKTIEVLHNIDIATGNTEQALLNEFNSRSFDLNTGGIVKEKLVTAYREQAIAVATYLQNEGVMRAADVKKATGIERAPSIMSLNHYQWFKRVKRGHYTISDKFLKDIIKYKRLHCFYRQIFCKIKEEKL